MTRMPTHAKQAPLKGAPMPYLKSFTLALLCSLALPSGPALATTHAAGHAHPSGPLCSEHPGTPPHAAAPRATPSPTSTYVCEMHPEVRSTKPGRCPKCRMHLVPLAKPSPRPRG